MLLFENDKLLSEQGTELLKKFYMNSDETSPQELFRRVSYFFAKDKSMAERIYQAVSKQWFMFSSPILSNAGEGKGMPISCFLSYVPDTVDGLINHEAEVKWLSVLGGGVGGHWDDVRAVSKKAPGPIPFIHSVDGAITAYKQGQTRKGAYAAYLDVSHPDIKEFLQVRVPTGGDINRKCLNIHTGVNISDKFMEAVKYDRDWELVDPKTKEVREVVKARDIWKTLLEVRHRTGESYLNFIDTANRALHPVQKKKGLKIHGSNLCLVGDTKLMVREKINPESKLVCTYTIDIKDINPFKHEVYAQNLETGIDDYYEISEWAQTGIVTELIEIRTQMGEVVRCTPEHKIYTVNRGYVMAKDLDPAVDMVHHFLGTIELHTVETITVEPTPVYDITVPGTGNFYANDILVHNCNEIHLVTDEERTAVCCLLSLNLETYDEWKDTTLISDLVEFLDDVLEYFIQNAPDVVSKAKYAAMRSRDIGIGAMGWHGYLMKNMIPFESQKAIDLTDEIFSKIKQQALDKTIRLAHERGSCPDAEEFGVMQRNLHLLAIAPNANSSMICNCTPSIEPAKSNGYAHRTRAGTHLIKNKYLEPVIEKHAPNDFLLGMLGKDKEQWIKEQWQSIIRNDGSVQHLTYLSDEEKSVFKTFAEIDMHWVIEQSSVRQKHLCQGQSVNLYFPAVCDRGYINSVHFKAWEKGLKGLYYLRTGSQQKADKVSTKIERAGVTTNRSDDEGCTACHA